MKFASWLRGITGVVMADVDAVFVKAKTVVNAAPLPTNIKNDLTQTLTDTQGYLNSIASLAGTLAGQVAANGVDDLTTLLINTAGALSAGKSFADFSTAEKTVLAQVWTAMKAQGDTLVAQVHAGIDPTKPSAAPAPNSGQAAA